MATLRGAACSSPCLVAALGLAPLPDLSIACETAPVRCAWVRDHGGRLTAQLSPPGVVDGPLLPLGHQAATEGLGCPILADAALDPLPPREMRLGAVAVAIDADERVLLTRRPQSMRSFPGAWVMPGGSVDVSDATVAAAALRELLEETGLAVAEGGGGEAAAACLWESCFPVSCEQWREARAAGGRVSHFLVAYVPVRVGEPPPLILHPEECDCAVWVPLAEAAGLVRDADGSPTGYERARVVGGGGGPAVPLASLRGVYPNEVGEGIARGHLWALRQLLAMRRGAKTI